MAEMSRTFLASMQATLPSALQTATGPLFKQFDERVAQRFEALPSRLHGAESKIDTVSALQEDMGCRIAKLESELDVAKAQPPGEPPARTAEWDRPKDFTVSAISGKDEVASLHVQAAIGGWLQDAG
ncbi:unnamed protein product [Prorocentrum cordatum]|uniref:Uncharacterized protein n=1 Tax=Prorocentrum cordatum TaxID=2364126 RepID=A0ABN9T2N5_9DINO|nr:unnamed protein product [Polarella glacialis]